MSWKVLSWGAFNALVDAVKTLIDSKATLDSKQTKLATTQANLDAAIDAGVRIEINEIDLSYDNNATAEKKNLSIKKYFAKVQPKLSLTSNNNDELVVEISNPSDSYSVRSGREAR